MEVIKCRKDAKGLVKKKEVKRNAHESLGIKSLGRGNTMQPGNLGQKFWNRVIVKGPIYCPNCKSKRNFVKDKNGELICSRCYHSLGSFIL